MKQLGCALLVLVVVAAGFIGLVAFAGFLIGSSPDQSHLTREVDVTVVKSEQTGKSRGSDWELEYRYRVQGQWYGAEDKIDTDYWTPGDPLAACVNPDESAEHVLRIHLDDQCGQEFVSSGINSGTPTNRPER